MLGLVDELVEAALASLEIQRAAKCPLHYGNSTRVKDATRVKQHRKGG
tara:strand:- start:166 stop:309 length:144 start_codon:yes stop_codon:yes gene_type:complete